MISFFKSQSSYNFPVSYKNNLVIFSLSLLSLTLLSFMPCRLDLWNKQKPYTQKCDHQVREYGEDLSSFWDEEDICKHHCVWKPDAQADYSREYKLVHLVSVLKAIQVYFSCEGCKNYYTQNSDAIQHTEYD